MISLSSIAIVVQAATVILVLFQGTSRNDIESYFKIIIDRICFEHILLVYHA